MISVIMPVYNSEDYLRETIASILNQSYTDFELILVDDGSKDSSGKICDEYSAKDKRIRVIHKKNGGICSARNAGTNIARGEYIAFCDNDDLFERNLLQDNYNLCIKYNADIVKYGCREVFLNEGVEIKEIKKQAKKDGFYRQCNQAILDNENYNFYWYLWDGIYKKDIIVEHKFNEEMKFGMEDAEFCYRIFAENPSIAINSKIYYTHYIRGVNNTSQKFNVNKLDSIVLAAKSEKELFRKIDMYNLDMNWVMKEEGKWFTGIMSTMELQNCKLDLIEKKKMLKKYGEILLEIIEKNIHWKEYFKCDRQHCFIVWLFKRHWYACLTVIEKIHYK